MLRGGQPADSDPQPDVQTIYPRTPADGDGGKGELYSHVPPPNPEDQTTWATYYSELKALKQHNPLTERMDIRVLRNKMGGAWILYIPGQSRTAVILPHNLYMSSDST